MCHVPSAPLLIMPVNKWQNSFIRYACLFHIVRVKRTAKCYMLYWGENLWTNKQPKTWILTWVSTWVHAEGAASGQPEVPVTSLKTCFSVLQLASRPSWWPLSSVYLPHVQLRSRLSKYGFWSSSSTNRAVCRSSKVCYWLNLFRPKSENNFKGSRPHLNFKKQLTIKTTTTTTNSTGLRMH